MERTSHSSTPVKGEAALSSTEKRIYIFEKAPVRRAVLQQMLPTVAGQMVALLYNLADTFFVGLLNAPIQTAAVTVAYPPFLMMTAVSNLFGIGGASAVSHALGRRDMDGARRISAIAFWLSLASAAVFSLLCGSFLHPLLSLCGADAEVYPVAAAYARWTLLWGGAGTILNLLLSNLLRAEGRAALAFAGVTLGGVPVQELQQEQRLRTLTLVPHNAAIFKGTVESNLRMAKPDASETELWNALEQVNLADFCRSQNGLQTALHEGGSNLSGGQRQRLAMARALLHDTPIYLFDEATSNVDAESENDIMRAIHSLAGKKTIILISHRLANVVHSDCIYAMSNGRVTEQGTHAELLAKQGAYSRLYLAQRQLETLEEEDA